MAGKASIIILLWVIPFISLGQQWEYLGFPDIQNYSPEEYDGHIQNWGFTEDSNGVIYFANLQSIIRYDGVNWDKISVPNSRVYSIITAEDGKIFVGGSNELGYIDTSGNDSLATPQYYSIRSLLPDSINLGRIFSLHDANNEVVFQSSNYLIHYDGDSAFVQEADVRFSLLHKKKDELYLRDALEGIKKIGKDSLTLIPGGEFFDNISLLSFLQLEDKMLYCSNSKCYTYQNKSFLPFDTEADQYLASRYLDEAIPLRDGTIAIATRTGGVVHLDGNGNLIRIIDEDAGLISNTVYGLYEDQNGSVWVATVNGISRIDFSVPLRYYDERSGIAEGINNIVSHNNNLVFSSSQGIYYLQNGINHPKKYEQVDGCIQLTIIEGDLFGVCGGRLIKESDSDFTTIRPIITLREIAPYDDSGLAIFGNENGFNLVKLEEETAEVIYSIDDLTVNPVSIYIDKEKNIWVATSVMGLFKVTLEWNENNVQGHNIEQYFTELQNEEDDKRALVTRLNEEPAFLTWGKGIQRYNYDADSMEQDTRFGDLFSDTTRQFFWAEEDLEGNVWFRSGGEYQAALLQKDGSYQPYEGALKLIDHRQSNDIFPDENGYVWYATDRGVVRFDKNHNFDHTKPFHTQINKVLVRNDSLINGGDPKEETILDYEDNELRFTFAGASYFAPGETQYRVRLNGFEDNWTSWNNEAQKDYTNIPEGDYEFEVQAKNLFGVVSNSAAFPFTILPPWYRTWWAYFLYTLGVSGILYTAYKVRINQILRVQRIRNNIASDLHDEVSATLSSISYFAQAIQSDKLGGDKNRFVNLIANSAGDAKEKITDIVWAINPEHDDWQGFLSKCRRFASDLLESREMGYSLKIDEYIPGKLNMQLRQHLWLIFKEMVTNAVRHSEASQLDIILKYEEGYLQLVVQDNGKGMDVDRIKKGNGMVNIHKRADLIDADVSLKTSEGFGTRWRLKLSL